jgi:hypothetical protein
MFIISGPFQCQPTEFAVTHNRLPKFYLAFVTISSYASLSMGIEKDLAIVKQNPKEVPKTRFSGQFNVWVPKDLHRELVTKAEEKDVSLNALVTYLLSQFSSRGQVLQSYIS